VVLVTPERELGRRQQDQVLPQTIIFPVGMETEKRYTYLHLPLEAALKVMCHPWGRIALN
jgi:hypothetical protein